MDSSASRPAIKVSKAQERAIPDHALVALQELGPFDVAHLEARRLSGRVFAVVVSKSLILLALAVGLTLLGLQLLIRVHQLVSPLVWNIALGVFFVACAVGVPRITARLVFSPPDLVNTLRADGFRLVWKVGAVIGFFVGVGICFLLDLKTGEMFFLVAVSSAFLGGDAVALYLLKAADSGVLDSARSYIETWRTQNAQSSTP